jgi:hypothetical protein
MKTVEYDEKHTLARLLELGYNNLLTSRNALNLLTFYPLQAS